MVERKKYLYSNDILVSSGKGGNGCVSFRREALVPKGGPDGGDGGKGGSVFIAGSRKLETIMDFKYKRVFRARNGQDGSSNNKTGASGSDLTIKVPIGTEIWHEGKLLFDVMDESPKLIAKGGRGGFGNLHFATPDLQTPYIATEGDAGQELLLDLVLKHLADVGVIGMPNAGKSTLVYKVSKAPVKIADYAFSTMEPVLGVIRRKNKTYDAYLEQRQQVAEKILALEKLLLKPEVRKSSAKLEELISEDFMEIGVSGQIYGKAEVVSSLPQEVEREFSDPVDFDVTILPDNLILATYRLDEINTNKAGESKMSFRSSVWKVDEGRYKLIFHQGFAANDEIKTKYEEAQIKIIDFRNKLIDEKKDYVEDAKEQVKVSSEGNEEASSDLDDIDDEENRKKNKNKANSHKSERLIIADLPGLLEGSHKNIGLGHRFLQHLYRCKLLLHVVDGSDPKGFDNFIAISQELELYDAMLLEKPQIVCISKADIAPVEQLILTEGRIRQAGYKTLILSANCENLIELIFGG